MVSQASGRLVENTMITKDPEVLLSTLIGRGTVLLLRSCTSAQQ